MPTNELKAFLERKIPFTPALFARGHSVFAPILTWEWVTLPSAQEMKTQLAAARRAGFGTVYILPMPKEFRPLTMETALEGYLGDAFFRAVKTAVETARSAGLHVWIYDEGGWPSGGACGQVTAALPALCEKRLKTDADGTVSIRETPDRADIYSRRAAAYFTEITHHAYAAALGEQALDVEAVFTDEPAGAPNAISPEIFDAFIQRYGYDLRARLPALISDGSFGTGDRQVRQDYFSVLESLFCGTLATYRQAAADHGWLLLGHLDRDHTADACWRKGYGNLLAALRMLDVPGVDVIDGQIRSDGNRMDGMALDFYPRFAASAALQNGTPLALSESFAVYGNALCADEMRYIINYQIVRGVNLFNYMQMPSTVETWFAFMERPVFHPAIPGFFALEGLNKTVERACLFMGTGMHCADVALFYPSAELTGTEEDRSRVYKTFRAAGDALELHGVDFDLIDLPMLAAGTVENGRLCCGAAAYTKIVVPDGCTLPPDVARKLASLSRVTQSLVKTDGAGFLHRTVRDENGDLHICVFNGNRTAAQTSVEVFTRKRLYLADPQTGTFTPFFSGDAVRLYSGECAFLFASDAAVPVTSFRPAERKGPALKPVSAKKTAVFRLTKDGAFLCDCAQTLRFAEDYISQVGAGFSGEITLTYTFFLAEALGDMLLQADRLCHFAEVHVNSERCGSFSAAPYRLLLKKEVLRRGENSLAIRLSNLPAAAYAAADAERFFTPKQLGPYHARTLAYEKEITGFGISGLALYPVDLVTAQTRKKQ